MSVSAKLKTLKAGQLLRAGGLLAHPTSTVAGIAASAYSSKGIKLAQRFKQRRGPFLLLADSITTALKQAVVMTPTLRKLARQSWPGAVTLVFPAKQTLHQACYYQGLIAIRVDEDVETRRLAKSCGGLLLSSSLNRKGKPVEEPNHKLKYRWKRHVSIVIPTQWQGLGKASRMFRVSGNKIQQLR